jgi:MYXO-CTERM domain-containing protein
MQQVRKVAIFVALAMSLTGGAQAASISASAETNVNTVITADSDNSPGSAFAQATDADNEALATAAADDSGRLATSAEFSGSSGTQALVTATSSWSETFSASAGSNAKFDFYIPGGAIGFEANNAGPLEGGYRVEIEFNGAQVFLATGDVAATSKTPETADHVSLTQTGTVIGSSFDNGISDDIFGSPGAGYRFDEYIGSLDLVSIDGDNTISYTMTVFVQGLIGETSALASIGDPLDLTVNPGVDLQVDTAPPPQQVTVDVKPGSDENPINLKSKGVIPIAVLGSMTFDALQIDYDSVAFGPGKAKPAHDKGHVEDSNGDGFMDMVFHFRTQESNFDCGDIEATFTARTMGGTEIEGSDKITIKQCANSGSGDSGDDDDDSASSFGWWFPVLLFGLACLRRLRRSDSAG